MNAMLWRRIRRPLRLVMANSRTLDHASVILEKISNGRPDDLPADGTGVGVGLVVVQSLDEWMHDVSRLSQRVTELAHVALQPAHFVCHVDQ